MKRIKPNIVDIFVIIALFVIIASTIFRWLNSDKLPLASNYNTVVYTIKISEEDTEYTTAVKIGDKLYLYESNEYCGEVTNIKYENSSKFIIYPNGTEVKHENPSKVDITLTVKIDAKNNINGFIIDDDVYIFEGQIQDFLLENE